MSFAAASSWMTLMEDQLKTFVNSAVASNASSPSIPSLSVPDAFSSSEGSSASSSASSGPSTKPIFTKRNTKEDPKDSAEAVIIGFVLELGVLIIGGFLASWFVNKLISNQHQSLDDAKASTAAEARLSKIMTQRGRPGLPALTQYESMMAQDVVNARELKVGFKDIGGLDDFKQEIWELAVLPLQRPDLFSTDLLQQPGGILLYGPPGTGKTMIAKAIAKEADATFISIKLSKIMNKWFGESNKLIDATFSLALKLSPSIIFIDELDTFLNPRDGTEGSAGNAIKAEFLTLWDGLNTQEGKILVLGATNRPNHVDGAILRRLPRMFRIGLPNPAGRLQILKLTLGNHPVEDEVTDFLPELSKITRGYSGSDLKELCKCAALESVREMIRDTARKAVREGPTATVDDDTAKEQTKKPKLRPMKIADIKVALTKVKKTGQAAAEYDASRQSTNPSAGADDAKTQAMLKSMIPLLRMLSTSTQLDNGEDDEKSDGDGNAIPEIE